VPGLVPGFQVISSPGTLAPGLAPALFSHPRRRQRLFSFFFSSGEKKRTKRNYEVSPLKMLTKLFRLAPFRSLEGMCKRLAFEIERDLPSIRFIYR
jgi:hypothetical protein